LIADLGDSLSDAFKFRAFISYSHADESWAKWLHHRLERYRVPSRLIGTAGRHGPVPKRVGRCFRDQAEMSAASDLGEMLQQALRDAQALIIVCSPHSAASRWVNEEISFFQGLGKGASIYALVVDGEPNARDPAMECFPPAMLKDASGKPMREPLAADARPGRDGKADAFLKLTAGLIGVGFDELRRREQRRRARSTLAVIAVSLLIAVSTSFLAISAYRARNEASQRRAQADDLVLFMLGDLQDRLGDVGRLEILDAVVAKSRAYLAAGDSGRADDRDLAITARALVQVAANAHARRQVEEGLLVARQAEAAARELVRRKADDHSRTLLVLALDQVVALQFSLGQFDEVLATIAEARAVLGSLPEKQPNLEVTVLAASLDFRQGWSQSQKGAHELGRAPAEACAERLTGVIREADVKTPIVMLYVQCRANAMLSPYLAADLAAAAQAADRFMPELDELVARHARSAQVLGVATWGYDYATRIYTALRRLELAAEANRHATEVEQRLMTLDPENTSYPGDLSRIYVSTATIALARADWKQAEAAALEAIEICQRLLKLNPKDSDTRAVLLKASERLGRALAGQGRIAEALAAWDSGLAEAGGVHQLEHVLALRLQRLRWTDPADPRGKAEHEAAQSLLTELEVQYAEKPGSLKNLMRHQMVFAYLHGDVSRGDELYAEIRAAKLVSLADANDDRNDLCAWLARKNTRRCSAS
jgi:tetratricopeptide (TPR) repeat protein